MGVESEEVNKVALITGITGQDGAYLAEFLLNKGYAVHGIRRRSSIFNTERIDHLYHDPHEHGHDLALHYGDLTDTSSVVKLVSSIQPDEIYNLGAQSHVAVSFEEPEYTANTVGMGCLRLLEAVRTVGLTNKTKFYQASSSEMYGVAPPPQRESTSFYPRSPYAIAKIFAYWTTINYREAYGVHASNGILFNHESPIRGETFVTRKITRALARIHLGLQSRLYLGNLDSKRDWGHARDYVEAQWLMLQQPLPGDYVVATGVQRSVRDFVTVAARCIGIDIDWKGSDVEECGLDRKTGRCIVSVDSRYFRPAEVDNLLGDAHKIRDALGWMPRTDFESLVKEMVWADLKRATLERIVRDEGQRLQSAENRHS